MNYATYILIFFYALLSYGSQAPQKISYNLVSGLTDIYITPFAEKIGHTWTNGTIYDKQLIEKFYSLLPKNKFFVVFDFGAQTGCFTLLSKFFPNSHWYAFEPIQEAADVLTENLKLNGISNVTVCPKAAADFTGKVILNMPNITAWGLATIGQNVIRFNIDTEREIQCVDLDSYVAEHKIKKIDFIKLDTEGAELSILRGGKKTITRDRPIILMEYHEINMRQCGVTKDQVDSFLRELGYTWQQVSIEDILCIP